MDESDPFVAKHLRLAKTMRQLLKWRSHLIHQMHEFKSKPRKQGQRYKMNTRADKWVYDVQLFLGLPRLTSLDTYPCEFRHQLEKVMWKEVGIHVVDTWSTEDMGLYYDYKENLDRWTDAILLEGCPQLDESSSTLTTGDLQIIKDFNSRCLEFVNEAIALVDQVKAAQSSTLLMKRYRRRLQNGMDPPPKGLT